MHKETSFHRLNCTDTSPLEWKAVHIDKYNGNTDLNDALYLMRGGQVKENTKGIKKGEDIINDVKIVGDRIHQ